MTVLIARVVIIVMMVLIAIKITIATKLTMGIMVTIFVKNSGYHTIFSSNSVAKLPKYTNINNNLIDLVGNLLNYPLTL